jgi:hypothetical protein
MNRARSTAALCVLCILVVSGVAAQGAQGAGTTAFTCQKSKGTLRGEHCLTTGNAPAEYGHVAFQENLTTEVSATSQKTQAETSEPFTTLFKETIAGTEIELGATEVHGTGTMENKKGPGGEHYVSGLGSLVYTGVEVTKPAGKGCEVTTDDHTGVPKEGAKTVVDTEQLRVTTEGQGHFLKIEPAMGTTLATFWITCTDPSVPMALQGTWSVTGSLKCPVEGATVVCDHNEVTTQNTLKGKGSKAGYSGKLTISGKAKGESTFFPLSPTTVT